MPHYTSNKVNCTCEHCHKSFTRFPSEIKRGYGKYCSRACMDLAKRVTIDLECEYCHKPFQVMQHIFNQSPCRFCSRECLFESMQKRIDRICEQCGNSFTTIPIRIKNDGAKYCSNECRHIANRGQGNVAWRGGHSSYRGENWLQQRKLARERDKNTCQHCGKKSKRRKHDVHHIRPYRLFNGDYVTANQLTNLITLCQTCHKLAEHGSIEVQPYLI
jgi:hypothetical protein